MPQEPQIDFLNRDNFIKSIAANISVLAKMDSCLLPAPRVIAINAKWGNGKTWVATELHRKLQGDSHKAIYIDAFRYDHHDDPFTIIASEIYSEISPKGAKKRQYLEAARGILASAAPIASKLAVNFAARTIGLTGEDLTKAVEDTGDAVSAQSYAAVEKMFDSYAQNHKTQEKFMGILESIAESEKNPIVVIIDEMDRCRPSFALEVLERVKHIFSVPNVVFVFFWNSLAIHESIRHTYGRETEAENYLSKFVAFEIPLPHANEDRNFGVDRFIREYGNAYFGTAGDADSFNQALQQAAWAIKPNLREIQKCIHQWTHTNKHIADYYNDIGAYLTLLSIVSPIQFQKLKNNDTETIKNLVNDFNSSASYDNEDMNTAHACLAWLAQYDRYEQMKARGGLAETDNAVMNATRRGATIPIFIEQLRKVHIVKQTARQQ